MQDSEEFKQLSPTYFLLPVDNKTQKQGTNMSPAYKTLFSTVHVHGNNNAYHILSCLLVTDIRTKCLCFIVKYK